VGEGVLVGAVGGTTVGAGACVGGSVVGTVAGVVGEPVGEPPGGAVVAVDSLVGAAVVVCGAGDGVDLVRTTCLVEGGSVPADTGRTQ
jgi:hypothetical protein